MILIMTLLIMKIVVIQYTRDITYNWLYLCHNTCNDFTYMTILTTLNTGDIAYYDIIYNLRYNTD